MDDHAIRPHRAIPFEPLRLRLHPGGHAIDLTAADLVLGRHSEADLRMALPDISRRHCRFLYSEAGWELIDLGSLNGVYLNGARVERSRLRIGDTIRICSLEFEVEYPDDEAAQIVHSISESMLEATRKSA